MVFVAVQNDFKNIDSMIRFTCQLQGQLLYLRNKKKNLLQEFNYITISFKNAQLTVLILK